MFNITDAIGCRHMTSLNLKLQMIFEIYYNSVRHHNYNDNAREEQYCWNQDF